MSPIWFLIAAIFWLALSTIVEKALDHIEIALKERKKRKFFERVEKYRHELC